MADRPTGTVTFLFTDIEGSTRLLQRLGAGYGQLLSDHHRLVRDSLDQHRGIEVKTEGDSFFVVFLRAADAVAAATAIQRALAAHTWPDDVSVGVRMGVHTGETSLVGGEYVGLDVHRAARISAAANGGQVLLSEATRDLVRDALPEGVSLRDQGEHRLRDLDRPEHLYQLVIEGLSSSFGPIRSVSARFDVLPAELTSFIGREAEVSRIDDLLAGTRLLTLTGPGGTGKTRLAVHAARRAADSFRDGVAFVALAPITDPQLVPSTIRQALGLAEQVGSPAEETIAQAIHSSELLLVLDNFEQVVGAAPVVGRLLADTDGLKVLATSRAPLRISGEQEFPVPPLRLPRTENADDPEIVSQSEAVSLFMQRARTVRPDFELTAANARAIVEICVRLDGLPLAIELAASRIKLLAPEAMLARLSHSLDLLQGPADRSDRQRTLRGAIDWSHDLLGGDERATFRRLAIFVGGWTLEAAEAIIPAAGATAMEVLDGLGALVDHSLVRQQDFAAGLRFLMLETIREYGLEQLSKAGEADATARAHAQRFLHMVIDLAPTFTSSTQALDAVEGDHDNVRAALDYAAAHDDVQLALEAAGALWRFWHLRGHIREGSRRLSDLLSLPGAPARTLARAQALNGLASLRYWQNDFQESERLYRESLELARELDARALAAQVLYSLGYIRTIPGDYEDAKKVLDEAQEIYASLGDRHGSAYAKSAIGLVLTVSGDHAGAIPVLQEARAAFRELGESYGYLNTSTIEISARINVGDVRGAGALIIEMLEAQRTREDLSSIGMLLYQSASVAAMEGQLERAATLLGAMEGAHERLGGQAPRQLVNAPDPMPAIHAGLPQAAIDERLAEGRQMDTQHAIAFASDAARPATS